MYFPLFFYAKFPLFFVILPLFLGRNVIWYQKTSEIIGNGTAPNTHLFSLLSIRTSLICRKDEIQNGD